jgi:hypothetical protein
VLDVNGFSTADGTRIQQWTDQSTANQQWRLKPTGDGYYELVNRNSGKVLGIAGNSTAQGAAAEQQTDSSATSQEWRISEVSGSDAVTLTSRGSGHVLDISGGSTAEGAAVVRYPRFRHPPRHPARPQQPQSTVHECRYATNCLRDRRS